MKRHFRHSLLQSSSPLVIFLSVALLGASAQQTFTTHAYSSGDYDSSSIASGDFDNDGILDLVTINAQSISFYKGLGAGRFAAAKNQNLSLFYRQQAVTADFNRDGKLDLAVTCSSCSFGTPLTILFGNGDGTFTEGAGIPESDAPYRIAAADFNGDHIPDLAVSSCDNSNKCYVHVFLGKGDGTFTSSATLGYGGGPVVVGDFNADGHQDIAVLTVAITSGQISQLVTFLGNGNGTFQNAALVDYPNTTSLAVGDFFNNRIQSLAILSYDSSGNYYLGTVRFSNGSMEIGTPVPVGVSGPFYFITAGDLNGDFIDDVVLTGGAFTCDKCIEPLTYYMLGNGNGTFENPISAPAYGQYGDFPFVRDLNLDSRHDIGLAWDSPYEEEGGGAFIILDDNAPTNCTPPKPNALGVHICSPANGQTISKTFTYRAAGNAFDGIAKRMELWIDGKKMGQNLEDQMKVTATVAAGAHTASFVVVDSFDDTASQSVSFTSK